MGGRVLIVEDHELLAQSLSLALGASGLEVHRCTPADADTVLETVRAREPEVVLLDLDLGEPVGSSVPLIEPMNHLGARVVIMTGITDRYRLAECVEAGAAGLLSKSRPFEDLVAAVHTLLEGGALIHPPEHAALMADLRRQRDDARARRAAFDRLTPREQEVLGALMDGKPAEVIARESVVSVSTVRSQIRSLLVKLGVNSQLSAVALARRAGWQPGDG